MKQVINPQVAIRLDAPQSLDTQRLRYAVRRLLTQWAMTVLLSEDGQCVMPVEGFEAETPRVLCQLDLIQGPADAANVISEVFCLTYGAADGFLPESCRDIGEQLYRALLQWNTARAPEA